MTCNRRFAGTPALLLLLAALPLGGCWAPGGTHGFVRESDTFESTVDMPQTVTLIDRRTGETLWSYDVPVDMQLSLKFSEDANKEVDPAFPDLMKWDIWERGTMFGNPANQLPAPNKASRFLDVKLRKRPELPETMRVKATPATAPVAPAPAPAPAAAPAAAKPATPAAAPAAKPVVPDDDTKGMIGEPKKTP